MTDFRTLPANYRVTGWIDSETTLNIFSEGLEKLGFCLASDELDAKQYKHPQLGNLTLTAADPHLLDGEINAERMDAFFQSWMGSIDAAFSAQLDFFEEDGRLIARRVFG